MAASVCLTLMPDFSTHRITWSPHALDRQAERSKSIESVERLVRTSQYQIPSQFEDRWEVLGCVDGEMSTVVVKPFGHKSLVVITVYGVGLPCS